jgi:L-lactate utilization protein LutC
MSTLQTAVNYTAPASEATLQAVAEHMRARNIEVIVVDRGEEALRAVLERVPAGSQVHTAKSKTLQDTGIFDVLNDPLQYDALRHKYMKMDRATQANEIRRLIAAPDTIVGSVNAVTEDGILVAASATSGQIGPYANTAGKVIFVVGSQKIVPDLDAALKRVRDYVLPWEDAQVRQRVPSGSFIGKTLIIEREWVKDRMTVILVREPVGY